MFGTMDDSMLARMEASLAAVADMKAHHMPQHPVQQFKTDSHHPELNYMNTYNKPHFTFTGMYHRYSACLHSSQYPQVICIM